MIEQDYTREELKKAMLNEACPHMEAYYSDLCEDFIQLDKMKVGQTAQWFYRLHGTSFRVEDPENFTRDLDFWKKEIFEAYTILRTGRNKYSVKEIKLKS